VAVQNWHGGQVVVLWAGLVLVYAVVALFSQIYVDALRTADPVAWRLVGSIMVGALFADFALLLVGLVVTWRWFGSRRSR
jgi:hypothetical protein